MWNNEYKSMQGNIGLGRAIAYFTSVGITVCLPINDTQKFDLVADIDGLKKVSIKTTAYQRNNDYYTVQLKNTGGSSGKGKIRLFDSKSCEYLFVLCSNNDMYLIPSCEITAKSTLTLTDNFDKYKVYF